MTKHDRLMKALKEIKSICAKNEDYDSGCGEKCPFLKAEDESGFRGCEVTEYVSYSADCPFEWGE